MLKQHCHSEIISHLNCTILISDFEYEIDEVVIYTWTGRF